MAKVDVDLERLLIPNIDGIPLEIANKLLPRRAKFKPGVFMHISMHAKSQTKHANTNVQTVQKTAKVSDNALLGILSSLESTVKSLQLKKPNTEWADYYTFTNYNEPAFNEKKQLVQSFVQKTGAKTVLDMGANNGLFSRVAAEVSDFVISADIDPFAVEQNYLTVKQNGEQNILPVKFDIVNPSPAIGWNNHERQTLAERAKNVDVVMALALVHHLAISNNVPLEKVFEYFTSLGKNLIIEFVPKGDSQVDKLLVTRKDIFSDYNIIGFEEAAKPYYKLVEKTAIKGTKRTLYLFERKAK
jgi:predicted nicotinamide N-methyase